VDCGAISREFLHVPHERLESLYRWLSDPVIMSMPEAGSPETETAGQEAECHCLLAGQVDQPKSPASYASTTLRSTTSGHSIRTNSTTICESPGAGSSTSSEEEDDLECYLRGTAIDLGDAGLRYSFKGSPPELYSPRKDFISKGPLLDKQVGPNIYCIFKGLVFRLLFRGYRI